MPQATKIVAALSLKGGVGKTSVILGLAGAAMASGMRTLVVDLDPQANASASLDPADYSFTSSDVLFDGRKGIARAAIVASGWSEHVDVLPSELSLENRSQAVAAESLLRLKKVLKGVTDDYDLVLIDCPPTLSELTRNALYCANLALVVTEPSFFAVQGAEHAVDAIRSVSTAGNPELQTLGIVANRVRPTLDEHRLRMDELHAAFGDLLLGSIPDRSAVQQAQGARIAIQTFESNGASDFSESMDVLLGAIVNPEAKIVDLTKKAKSKRAQVGSRSAISKSTRNAPSAQGLGDIKVDLRADEVSLRPAAANITPKFGLNVPHPSRHAE